MRVERPNFFAFRRPALMSRYSFARQPTPVCAISSTVNTRSSPIGAAGLSLVILRATECRFCLRGPFMKSTYVDVRTWRIVTPRADSAARFNKPMAKPTITLLFDSVWEMAAHRPGVARYAESSGAWNMVIFGGQLRAATAAGFQAFAEAS